jgi:hypothetical protein
MRPARGCREGVSALLSGIRGPWQVESVVVTTTTYVTRINGDCGNVMLNSRVGNGTREVVSY